jgi:16S rRNA (uracil1498-N3)-methyltransferase
MSCPRFFTFAAEAREGAQVLLDAAQARHLAALRVRPGDPLELVLPQGPWRADLAILDRDRASARLVSPLGEEREALHALHAFLPVPAQLSLLDEMLPPLVELGVASFQPVVFERSAADPGKVQARMERWARILVAACEQCHRGRIPALAAPAPFAALLAVEAAQKWVAFENPTGTPNPPCLKAPIAFTSGPEGGITDGEFQALRRSGWTAVSLGPAILRAVTAPVALAGAIQFRFQQD